MLDLYLFFYSLCIQKEDKQIYIIHKSWKLLQKNTVIFKKYNKNISAGIYLFKVSIITLNKAFIWLYCHNFERVNACYDAKH